MMVFSRARVLIGALAMLVGVGAVAGAQQTESRIVGKVLDQDNSALPGATVTIISTQTGAVRTAVTQGDGTFAVTNLQPGQFELRAELSSFGTEKRVVTLGAGQIEDMSIRLRLGGVSESVTVTAEAAPLLELSAKTGVNVSPEEVKGLPVNGRNFANLMTLATGASSDGNGGWSSVRFNGKSNQQNYLNYDGVDGTYVWDASPGYLNATGSQFRLQTSMESIAEFRVNSGLAPAESGLGAGGNITVISKSGTNRNSGGVFEYFRNDALDSPSKYDDRKQALELNQFGGSLGGPIVANRTFFFASVERLKQHTGISFTEAVPSALARSMITNGVPTSSAGGRNSDRTKAITPLLGGFPVGTAPTSNQYLDLATLDTDADQTETAVSLRVDHRLNNQHSFYLRYLFSDGDLDTPDRTVTPRRVKATQQPQNLVFNFLSVPGGRAVNEIKVGYNKPTNDFRGFSNTPGYDPTQVSLTGSVNSSSVDARGTTGIARSGLLLRATSAASTEGAAFEPSSLSIADTLTWTKGTHTLKSGFEYRHLQSTFQFLGSTEIVFNSIQDFIDNLPASIRVNEASPLFKPQQYYLLGFVQDSWRASNRLTLELGLRYDFYSVVTEAEGRAKPFFIEENDFAPAGSAFYNPDKNNFSPRLSAAYRLDEKTVVRAGFGVFYGPGQFEDRIQPLENYIARKRANQNANNTVQYPLTTLPDTLSIRGYTHERPDEYNIQYGTSVARELPGQVNLTIGYTGSRGKDMFIRGVANTLDPVTRVRPVPAYGQIDYKTSGCLDGLVINGNAISGCGRATYDALQISATRRFRAGFTGGFQYQYSRNEGTTQGSNEAATAQNTFDYNTEFGINPQDIPQSFNGSLIYLLPGEGFWKGGWRVGGIVNARSGVPINVVITRSDTTTQNGATVVNIPGGNDRGTQRPDLVPGVDPYLRDGVRWLNPAAFTTPQPGTFGNLPRNYLRGPEFWQVDLTFSKDFRFAREQSMQLRVDLFNIGNRLNYENPASSLSSSTAGVPFTDATAGTFGYMLGPLNRTVGLGTARQTQVSLRYSF